ncbi:MAG: oligosaccharide flippase family protein [Candidatus Pacearchaeota archaeon]|nr:oligosaccharide flippase family protein [Candidatus Pacearchaeota archaeon]
MIKKFLGSEFGKGTIVLLIMLNIVNIINFIFHFVMGRMLGPEGYGILAVLMSLIYIYTIPAESIQNLISRYITRFSVNKEEGKAKFMILKSLNKIGLFSFGVFVILIPISIFLSSFLDINLWLILVANIFIFSAFIGPIARGTLQGRKKFKLFGSSMIIESIIKLLLGILLVLIGAKVFGALVGILVGGLIGIVFAFYFNLDLLKNKSEKIETREIYIESIPYFIVQIVILLVFSLDIILAKRFFSAELAGQYAVLSMIGKIIFFATMSISKAMFPLTCEDCENGKNPKKLFRNSLLMVLFLCTCAISVYALVPKLLVFILYGTQYLDIANYLFVSGIAFSFLSLTNLRLIYGLSVNKLKYAPFLFIFLIIEIIILSLFNDNILEYILGFMFSNIVMFIGSLFFVRR